MSKYIDVEKIPWTDLNDGRGGVNVYVTFLEKVARMPTADVAEVRHGRWEQTKELYSKDGGLFFLGEACSICGNIADEQYNYCPNCGAKMDEVNGISCDECEIAKYTNLEDDDTPCQNCEEPDAD